jgi:glycosyltransferase involved in cell wall biosynthesis
MDRMPIVVYSHLRWDSVFQRPQQLLSRLSRSHSVLFLEEPTSSEPGVPDSWELQFPLSNLAVYRPVLHDPPVSFDAERLRPMTELLLHGQDAQRHIAWVYTPMAFPLAQALTPDVLVYDCMDELSAFLGAPAEMRRREIDLLRAANLVFAGGSSLYRAKRRLHRAVRCLPSSVDAAHFQPARGPLPEPPDQAPIARPRLGFYGVLDERLDRELLEALAGARPDWQIVLVGPVAKIPPAALPQRSNLHYLGPHSYADLPAYLSGWDVCLLPFARNEATRFLSPTKTLEYMAAEKPIVSTRIRDVAEPYEGLIEIADDAASFVAACERALAETSSETKLRTFRMRQVLKGTSWDATVDTILRHLQALQRRQTFLASAPLERVHRDSRALS